MSTDLLSLYTGLIPDLSEIINSYNRKLYVYHVERNDLHDYDQYSDFVVIADSEESAKLIHPDGCRWDKDLDMSIRNNWQGDWVTPNNVTVKLIGEAIGEYIEGEVICTSYHAG
jgi:hypothetical protein